MKEYRPSFRRVPRGSHEPAREKISARRRPSAFLSQTWRQCAHFFLSFLLVLAYPSGTHAINNAVDRPNPTQIALRTYTAGTTGRGILRLDSSDVEGIPNTYTTSADHWHAIHYDADTTISLGELVSCAHPTTNDFCILWACEIDTTYHKYAIAYYHKGVVDTPVYLKIISGEARWTTKANRQFFEFANKRGDAPTSLHSVSTAPVSGNKPVIRPYDWEHTYRLVTDGGWTGTITTQWSTGSTTHDDTCTYFTDIQSVANDIHYDGAVRNYYALVMQMTCDAAGYYAIDSAEECEVAAEAIYGSLAAQTGGHGSIPYGCLYRPSHSKYWFQWASSSTGTLYDGGAYIQVCSSSPPVSRPPVYVPDCPSSAPTQSDLSSYPHFIAKSRFGGSTYQTIQMGYDDSDSNFPYWAQGTWDNANPTKLHICLFSSGDYLHEYKIFADVPNVGVRWLRTSSSNANNFNNNHVPEWSDESFTSTDSRYVWIFDAYGIYVKARGNTDQRYLKIHNQTGTATNLLRSIEYSNGASVLVQADWGVVALPRIDAAMSAVSGSSYPYKCIDGVDNTDGNLCHSSGETTPWLMIDMGSDQEVHYIDVYNRHSYDWRTRNIEVYVSPIPITSDENTNGDYYPPGNVCFPRITKKYYTVGPHKFRCTSPQIGRYVILHYDYTQPINLREVYVYGRGFTPVPIALTSASASSASTSYPISNCIDGDETTRCSTTNTGNPHWLSIDLGTTQSVRLVRLINRRDGYEWHLEGQSHRAK